MSGHPREWWTDPLLWAKRVAIQLWIAVDCRFVVPTNVYCSICFEYWNDRCCPVGVLNWWDDALTLQAVKLTFDHLSNHVGHRSSLMEQWLSICRNMNPHFWPCKGANIIAKQAKVHVEHVIVSSIRVGDWFLDDHCSDLIETCQVYCWGPVDVPFQGLILIGQWFPSYGHLFTKPMSGHGALTSRLTSQFFFFFSFFFHVRPRTYGRARTYGHARAKERPVWLLFLARSLKVFIFYFFCTYGHARTGTYGHVLVF